MKYPTVWSYGTASVQRWYLFLRREGICSGQRRSRPNPASDLHFHIFFPLNNLSFHSKTFISFFKQQIMGCAESKSAEISRETANAQVVVSEDVPTSNASAVMATEDDIVKEKEAANAEEKAPVDSEEAKAEEPEAEESSGLAKFFYKLNPLKKSEKEEVEAAEPEAEEEAKDEAEGEDTIEAEAEIVHEKESSGLAKFFNKINPLNNAKTDEAKEEAEAKEEEAEAKEEEAEEEPKIEAEEAQEEEEPAKETEENPTEA